MTRLSLLPLLLLALLAAAAAPSIVTARYDGELLRPFGIDAHSNQDALLSFTPFSVSSFSPRLALSVSNSECCDCVTSVAHHILDSALESVAAACANATCPVIKQRCEWIDAHKDEYTGVLAVELRPFTDGFMYCYGNGTCDHPGVPKGDMSSALLAADSSMQPQLLLSQMAAAAPMLEQAMRMRVDKSKVESEEEEDKDDSRIAELSRRIGSEIKSHARFARSRLMRLPSKAAANATSDDDSSQHHKRSCHSCLRHGVRWVLKRSIHHLKSVCKETTCPHLQKFCAWAKEHKEVVRGMVYAHVQPWKAAGGYCAGRGDCSCGGDKQQSARAAPFTMGEKDHDEHEDNKHTPVIGGGDHDKVPHGKLIGSITSKPRY